MKKKNDLKECFKTKIRFVLNEIKLGCKRNLMIKCAMKCGFGFFIAPPISQIATNQKIAIVVNKNAHGE